MKTLEDMKAQLSRIESMQATLIAADDRLWQSLGAVERKLERLEGKVDAQGSMLLTLEALLKGTADGVAAAIADLRGELVRKISEIQVLVVAEPPKPRRARKR
jgi:hypothetical protein